MVGWCDQNTNANYNTIDYAWFLHSDGVLRIYESGTNRGSFGAYAAGDILRIERTGTSVKYYRNNVLKRTVTASSTPALMADVSLYNVNTTVTNVRSSFSTETDTINRRFVYDHAGRLTHTWHQVDSQPEILLDYNEYNELGQLVDKKLHSTLADASDALQSVDYRYNIRGWMTSINNAELAADAGTNDETGDYFGMNLAYQDALGTGNTAQYNGNISAAKWSVNQGFGTIKAMAYNYGYDEMNRILSATHKQAITLGTWVTGQFDENGLTYDLNGNIKTLQRKGEGGVVIDNLTYNYGTGATASNKLLYVTDAAAAADKVKGFLDGNTSNDDYTYDPNGNMWTDKNKGITSNITYNFLNLPELVTRGGNTVRYIYDAIGRKLGQQVDFAGSMKRTDYAGEFIYENDVLQFINHEEGRIVVSGEKLLLEDGCENAGNMTASNATLATHTDNGEQYVKVTANGTAVKTGVFPIGGSFQVAPSQRYRIRAKGYRTGTSAVYLLIKANSTDLDWPGATLPNSSGTEAWIEQVVTIPAGTSTLQAGVTWNTVTAGEIFYLSEFMIEQLTSVDPEYQYYLKDHLGNVRVTFTSKDEADTYTATLEDNTQATEQATFKNYSRVTNDIYDHTDAGTTYDKAQLLNGGNNSQVGLTKSLAVMPGDTITAQVYAKYFESTGGSGNLSGFAAALLSAFGLPTPGAGEAGTAAAAIQDYGAFIAGGGNSGDPNSPKGWLNMLVFDKDYNLIDLAYEQLDEAYVQPVGNANKLPMQLLSVSRPIKEPGYVYIYLSNEGSVQQDVFFDDLKVTHTKSSIVQANDYYPFGLTFNSYQRENSVPNHYKLSSKELQDELDLGWFDYGKRMYQPEIGKWISPDPLAYEYFDHSPYSFVLNNPLKYVDPKGDSVELIIGKPYTDAAGKEHPYGHVALRVYNSAEGYDNVYDFGRYGRVYWNQITGEGILNVYNNSEAYLKEEQKIRESYSYSKGTSVEEDKEIMAYFDKLIAGGEPYTKRNSKNRKSYKLDDYNIFSNNCCTLSGEGLDQVGENWMGNEYDPRDAMKTLEKNYKSLGLSKTVYYVGGIQVTVYEAQKKKEKEKKEEERK
jgi:RHS repeat-associated protein